MILTKIIALTFVILPSKVAPACVNDPNFRYGLKTCKNIRNNKRRRAALCQIPSVNKACPQACGLCCEDDTSYKFKSKKTNRLKPCSWITKNNHPIKKYRRFKAYCTAPLHNFNGRTVRDACPVSCGFCQEQFSDELPQPTRSPSSHPSSFPTWNPSFRPSAQPTRPPSPQPSPFPSLRPTVSAFPIITPSALPTKIPSVTPTSYPSIKPSITPSFFPSINPSSSNFPSKAPVPAPSISPTNSFEPSANPSPEPSSSPSLSMKPSACDDSSTFFFSLENSPLEKRNCGWLTASTDDKDDKRLSLYCIRPDVKRKCCDSCSKGP